MFHRLATPTYFGGLPAGYDHINNPAANGDPGVPSSADGKKASGPNEGTYFVGFGEDATANFTNRGMKALSENTDILDDLFHRDIALTARTADVTAGVGGVSSFTIAGQIFVGENGVPNNQDQRDQLVSILDNNDNEIITAAGVKVQASLIHNGASTNVVGTQASGFFDTPTVNLNVAIPEGVTYRVYYGERSNLANLPKNAFTNIKIRSAQEVSADVERTLRDLHTTAAGANYNDPWTATINSLARTGLDGRYRHTTSDPGTSPALNTPGAGGTITRDGPAVRFALPTYDLAAFGTVGSNEYPDPALACLRLARVAPVNATAWNTSLGGDVGLMQESPFHNYADANEVAASHVTGPLVLDVIPRAVIASTLSGDAVITRITPAGVATANPDAGATADDRRTLQVAAGDFVRASGNSGMRRGIDLIEVTDNATNEVVGVFRVDLFISDTRVRVKSLTGANPPIGPSGAAASVRLRWLQPTLVAGGWYGAATAHSSNGTTRHFQVAAPGPLTTDWTGNGEIDEVHAAFLAALNEPTASTHIAMPAMGWGGFANDGRSSLKGILYGDGGIDCTGGRQRMNMMAHVTQDISVNNGGNAVAVDPMESGGQIHLFAGISVVTPSALTLSLDVAGGYTVTDGDELTIFYKIFAGTVGPASIVWPADFIFEGSDDVVPATNLGSEDIIVRYDLRYAEIASGGFWFVTRHDY